MRALHVGRVTGELALQVQRRIAGALGMVLVRARSSEQRHDAIAGILIHRTFEAVNAAVEDLKEAVQDFVPFLRIELLRQIHRALHVGKEHRDLLAFAFEGASRCEDLLSEVLRGVAARVGRSGTVSRPCQRLSAAVAKLLLRYVRASAARTAYGACKRRSAFATEARIGDVFEAAGWAAHGRSQGTVRTVDPLAAWIQATG